MTHRIVLIAGSPASESRSSSVLDRFGAGLAERGGEVERYSLDSFRIEDLLRGRFESDSIARFLKSIQAARGVLFSTPVYKATFAGALKLIIDTLAPTALEGKVVLAITTARLEPHLAEVDDSFQRLYRFFKGSIGQKSLGLLDTQLTAGATLQLDVSAQAAFDQALERYVRALA